MQKITKQSNSKSKRKKERKKKTETLSTREKRAYNNGRKSLDVSLQTLDQSNI